MSDGNAKIPFLPERLQALEGLSLNLLWRWNRRARAFFRNELDPVLWSTLRHNVGSVITSATCFQRSASPVHGWMYATEAAPRTVSRWRKTANPD